MERKIYYKLIKIKEKIIKSNQMQTQKKQSNRQENNQTNSDFNVQ